MQSLSVINGFLALRRSIAAVLAVVLFAVPTAAADLPYGKGLLWRIEKGEAAPSHLFGTIHLSDERVHALPGPVEKAFSESTSLTLELVKTKDLPLKVARFMMLNDGRRLSGIVGDDLFQATAKAAAPFGVPAAVLERFKPWAAFVSFSVPPEERARQAKGALPLDHLLQARAEARKLPVTSLETVEEQLGAFDTLSLADQIALLRYMVRESGSLPEVSRKVIDFYLARDVGGLLDWMSKQMAGNDPRLLEVYTDRLLRRRNHLMAKRMQARLRDGRAFIAVGAAHLPGKEGILGLLAGQGYTVTRVY